MEEFLGWNYGILAEPVPSVPSPNKNELFYLLLLFNIKFKFMKKMNFLVAIAAVCVCFLSACNASRPMSVPVASARGGNPFGETFTLPCEIYDTPTEFAATGVYRGSSYQKGECILNALANARQQVYEKYHHSYKGMISNYSLTVGNNRGNDIATKLQRN